MVSGKTMLVLNFTTVIIYIGLSTEIGHFHSGRLCRSGHKHVKRSCPRWDWNPRYHYSETDALQVEPRRLWRLCVGLPTVFKMRPCGLEPIKMLHCRLILQSTTRPALGLRHRNNIPFYLIVWRVNLVSVSVLLTINPVNLDWTNSNTDKVCGK